MSIIWKKWRRQLLRFVCTYDSNILSKKNSQNCNITSFSDTNYLKPNFWRSLLGNSHVEGCSWSGILKSGFCVHKTSGGRNCWKCGKNLQDILVFCDQCSSLQKANSTSNYFEIIGVDCAYDLNIAEVSKKYKNLQSQLHPDRFGNKTEEEKVISEEYSALVNKAYSTVINPLERGLYMLELNGFSIEEDSKEIDKLFLMEIMERNEEIENEKDVDKLRQLNIKNKESISSLMREVQEAFEKKDMKKAKDVLTKMKYYYTIDHKIKELKQKLGIPD